MAHILLKTTIPTTADDWSIARFAMLADHLSGLGHSIRARDRVERDDCDDADLAAGDFDQLWLFAVDEVGALTDGDCAAVRRAQAAGAGLLLTRDHQNLGACLTKLGPVGLTQHFQTVNPELDEARHRIDDVDTVHITWPNYHSGANGDVQPIGPVGSPHPILAAAGMIRTLPAHPHEGAVGVPSALAAYARVIATGRSKRSGATFNLAVAVDPPRGGRAVADSSFHHFCDYNWDPRAGCPSFVDEPPGDAILRDAAAARDARTYAGNIAAWLDRSI